MTGRLVAGGGRTRAPGSHRRSEPSLGGGEPRALLRGRRSVSDAEAFARTHRAVARGSRTEYVWRPYLLTCVRRPATAVGDALVHVASGLCVGLGGSGPGGPLQLEKCTGKAGQAWRRLPTQQGAAPPDPCGP
ncbi:hypothetical protein ACFCYC_04050 [Streptomyces sp. NPDC056402]|uniref:hypothetical protein n=1 Tax=Streptomyces sp. NPDC056402 TaxID=3345810 RepID=UPI0035D546C3